MHTGSRGVLRSVHLLGTAHRRAQCPSAPPEPQQLVLLVLPSPQAQQTGVSSRLIITHTSHNSLTPALSSSQVQNAYGRHASVDGFALILKQ